MRAGLHNQIKDHLTRAAFLCAALVLLTFLLPPLDRPPAPSPAPSPSSGPSATVVAFFGDSGDPLCAPLYSALRDFAKERSWRLISYDCKGSADSQLGQLQDFLRHETADGAVVYSRLDQEELDRQVEALYKTGPVVTIGQQAGSSAGRYVSAHIASGGESLNAAAAYFQKALRGEAGILLLSDLPDPDWEAACTNTFEDQGIAILDHGYTWTGEAYAQRYLETALEAFPDTAGILCTSRAGIEGSYKTLKDKGLDGQVLLFSLAFDQALSEDLALGRLDAAVTTSPAEVADLLEELLPQVLDGQRPGVKTLTPVLLTPDSLDQAEF